MYLFKYNIYIKYLVKYLVKPEIVNLQMLKNRHARKHAEYVNVRVDPTADKLCLHLSDTTLIQQNCQNIGRDWVMNS